MKSGCGHDRTDSRTKALLANSVKEFLYVYQDLATLMGDAIEVVAQFVSGECLKDRLIEHFTGLGGTEEQETQQGGTDGRT